MTTFRFLIDIFRPFGRLVLLSIFLGFSSSAANIGLMGTSAYLIARSSQHVPLYTLQVAIVSVRFFGLSRGIFRYLERITSHSVNLRSVSRLRTWLYQVLEPLSPGKLQDQRSGDILSRAIVDIEALEYFYIRGISPIFIVFLVTLGLGVFTSQFSSMLGLTFISGLVICGYIIPGLLFTFSRKFSPAHAKARGDLYAMIVDVVQGIEDLTAYGRQTQYREKTQRFNKVYNQAKRRLLRTLSINKSVTFLFNHLFLLVVFAVTVSLISNNTIRDYLLPVFILMTLASFEAISSLSMSFENLDIGLSSAKRLMLFKDIPPNVDEPDFPLPPPLSTGISIQHLTFRYNPEDKPVLEDINISLPQGKKVAVVGPSGAGKTTLVNIMLRFWDYHTGTIEFGERNLKSYLSSDIRQKIATITQLTYIFSSSLRQNLLVAKPGASDDQLMKILFRSELGDWVNALPDGLDSWLGEHGMKVSGGERQRIGVARALLRDSPVLIFDEPVAHLDVTQSLSMMKLIASISREKTILWVTHRLLGMEFFDEILVLVDGRIVQRGNHNELKVSKGTYAHYWDLQQKILLTDVDGEPV